MHALEKKGVPVLAGSIRDDTASMRAGATPTMQDAMRSHLRKATTVMCDAQHAARTIATGNMTCALYRVLGGRHRAPGVLLRGHRRVRGEQAHRPRLSGLARHRDERPGLHRQRGEASCGRKNRHESGVGRFSPVARAACASASDHIAPRRDGDLHPRPASASGSASRGSHAPGANASRRYGHERRPSPARRQPPCAAAGRSARKATLTTSTMAGG